MTMPTTEGQTEAAGNALRSLTGEEEALYDRQIRLWGIEAQRKLATSSVLIVCNPASLLAQEIAKNVVLAGISSLTFYSRTPEKTVAKADPTSQNGNHGTAAAVAEESTGDTAAKTERPGFLGVSGDDVVTALREMNTLVNVSLVKEEPVHLATFSVVCVIEAPLKEEIALNDRCRDTGVPFMCGRVAGEVGWLFVDAGTAYAYTNDKKQGADGRPAIETASFVQYRACLDAAWGGEVRRGEFGWHVACTLMRYEEEFGALPTGSEEDLALVQTRYQQLCKEKGGAYVKSDVVVTAARSSRFVLPPVTGIVGGLWGREAICIVSGRGSPLSSHNFFFFNAKTSVGSIEHVGQTAA